MLEVKVPSVGESISEVQIGQWLKQEGAWADRDESIVELETEKASVQVPAPEAGYIRNVRKQRSESRYRESAARGGHVRSHHGSAHDGSPRPANGRIGALRKESRPGVASGRRGTFRAVVARATAARDVPRAGD